MFFFNLLIWIDPTLSIVIEKVEQVEFFEDANLVFLCVTPYNTGMLEHKGGRDVTSPMKWILV